MIYCIENNQYGMGTSKERSSSNSSYYTMGNHIPGIKLDGMNVLMVREVSERTESAFHAGGGNMLMSCITSMWKSPGCTWCDSSSGEARTLFVSCGLSV